MLNKLRVLRAKAENKLYKLYFKAFQKVHKKGKAKPSDYEMYYNVSVDFTKNLQIIRNGGK